MKRIASILIAIIMLFAVAFASFNVLAAEKADTYYEYNAKMYYASGTNYLDEAAASLRDGFANRDATITFSTDSSVDYNSMIARSMSEEFATSSYHGDYLKYHIDSYSASISQRASVVTYTFNVKYKTNQKQEESVTNAVNSLINNNNLRSKNTVEQLYFIYDYICKNVKYDYDGLNNSSDMLKYSCYGALVNKRAVCQGYSLAFYRLCKELGIDCRIITSEYHAWNIVKIGSKYYNVDCTFDSENARYGYPYEWFLKCPASFDFDEDHIREADFTTSSFTSKYPMASSNYDYQKVLNCSHSYSYKYNDNSTHIMVCSKCDISSLQNCTLTTTTTNPTCTQNGSKKVACSVCSKVISNETLTAPGHKMSSFVVTKDATCTADGVKTSNCSACGLKTTQTIPATGHTPVVTKGTPATCKNAGKTDSSKCSKCGTLISSAQSIPALGHNMVTVNSKPATCKENGYIEQRCSRTDCGYTTMNTIEKLAHNYSKVVTQPTCNAQGYTTYTCSSCGDKYVSDYKSKLNHKIVTKSAVEPTCTKTGLTAGESCSLCGAVIKEQQTVPAKGHSYGEWIIDREATCKTAGARHKICTVCSNQYSDSIPITPHTPVTIKGTQATCTQSGLTDGTKCSVCNTVIASQSTIKALGHSLVSSVAVEPTCEDRGTVITSCTRCDYQTTQYKEALGHSTKTIYGTPANCISDGLTNGKICTRCNKVTEKQTVIPALGHQFSQWKTVKAAACEVNGMTARTCSACGETESAIIPALKHDVVTVYGSPASCTVDGLTDGTACKNCGKVYIAQSVIKATGHSFGVWKTTKAPTCTAKGIESRNCKKCDTTESRDLAKTGHSFGDWSVSKKPTCENNGEERRYCSICRTYESRTIPATNHIEKNVDSVAPTCTTDGCSNGVICSVCGKILVSTNIIPATGHNFGAWKTTKAPTCTAKGTESRSCKKCDATESRDLAKTGHSFGDWSVSKKPTCENNGEERRYCSICSTYESRTIPATNHIEKNVDSVAPTCTTDGCSNGVICSVCGKILVSTNIIPATGHSFGAWKTTKAPTCTAKGTESRNCTKCDYNESRDINATGHSRKNVSGYPASCTENGLSDGVICSSCGVTIVAQNVISAKGHSFGKWTVTQTADCINAGSQQRKCADCNYIETESIAKKNHSIVASFGKDATCTADGYTSSSYCSVCKLVVEQQGVIPAKGHSFSEWTVTKKPTCTTSGEKRSICSACGITDMAIIEVAPHSVVTVAEVKPTCTESGYSAYSYCSICNRTIQGKKVLPVKGHSFADVTRPASLTRKGAVEKTCKICGYVSSKTSIVKLNEVTLKKSSLTYTGKEQKIPAVTVKTDDGKTVSSNFYTVSCTSKLKNVGVYKIVVTFKGKYKGSKTITLKINPKNTSGLKLKASSKGFTASWKKFTTQTTGYEIRYSTNYDMRGAKTVTVSKNGTTSKKISNLKSNKKYYVQIRTYKAVGKVKCYSGWSGIVSVKTK